MNLRKGSKEYIVALTRKLHTSELLSNCISCGRFDEGTEYCRKYDVQPPAKIMALGCEEWDPDALPY